MTIAPNATRTVIQRATCVAMFGVAVGCAATTPGTSAAPATNSIAPALDAITQADLRRDMFAMAGDAMRGREAGTLDEMRATVWVAEQARQAGLQPAGDDGTFYQWWPMRRNQLNPSSVIDVAGRQLVLWRDAIVLNTASANLTLPVVFVADSDALAHTDVKGKAVAMVLPSISTQPETEFTIRGNFASAISQLVRQRSAMIARAGAAAAVIVANGDANQAAAFDANAELSARGSYAIDSAGAPAGAYARNRGGGRGGAGVPNIPTLWLRNSMLSAVQQPGANLRALIVSQTYYYPSGNVIGIVRGTDPALANEYVLYSAHQDHDGTRYVVNGDSIWNGADDNASVAVALLATARAFVKHPAKRPVLFVWHGAEERGLLGSRWFVNHPTVPHSQIIAVLNGDMIGRNNPDSAAILGVQPPHKNSNALVAAALRANAEVTHFKLDTIWDRPTHPEGWYFRSDHLPYARVGIPAVMFSTLLHADYHTPRDEPSRIDIPKLQKMTEWMYATGWIVANAPQRPDVVPGFKLER